MYSCGCGPWALFVTGSSHQPSVCPWRTSHGAGRKPPAAALCSHPSHISQLEMWGLFSPHLPGLAPEHAAVQPSALQMWTLLVEALHLEGL